MLGDRFFDRKQAEFTEASSDMWRARAGVRAPAHQGLIPVSRGPLPPVALRGQGTASTLRSSRGRATGRRRPLEASPFACSALRMHPTDVLGPRLTRSDDCAAAAPGSYPLPVRDSPDCLRSGMSEELEYNEAKSLESLRLWARHDKPAALRPPGPPWDGVCCRVPLRLRKPGAQGSDHSE